MKCQTWHRFPIKMGIAKNLIFFIKSRYIHYFSDITLIYLDITIPTLCINIIYLDTNSVSLDIALLSLCIALIQTDTNPVNLYISLPTLDITILSLAKTFTTLDVIILSYDRTFTTYKITSPTKVGNYIRMDRTSLT